MRAEELLAELEALGVVVSLDHEHLRLRPKSRLTDDLIEDLRAHKAEIVGLVELRQWPKESRDAVRRFGVPQARLYSFVRQHVTTPQGRGRLIAVFADRVEVQLAGRMSVFLPSEIRPPGVESQYEEPFEAVH